MICLESGLSLIGCHSHPFSSDEVNFSSIDDSNDLKNFAYAFEKLPDIYCGSMVFGKEQFKARVFDKEDEKLADVDEVKVLGKKIQRLSNKSTRLEDSEVFNRQVLLFGEEGQKNISDITASIVGAGGLGSIVFEMLARLGVGKIILVDDDRVETTNLNRLIGAKKKDVSSFKVDVLKEHAKLYSKTKVIATNKSVLDLSFLIKKTN